MQGLRLCSKQSTVPYHIATLGIHIYSIEELAYYLYNHAFFVEESFFSEELMCYIRDQLKMPRLAAKLKYLMAQKGSFKEKMLIVVEASKYYDEEECTEFAERVSELTQKTEIERMKLRANYLYKKGRLTESEKLLQEILKQQTEVSPQFLALIYLDLGKIKMQRFSFQEGKEDFAKAYGYCQEEVIAKSFIRSILLMLDYEGEPKESLMKMVQERLGLVEISESLIADTVEELKKAALRSEMTPEYEKIEEIAGLLDNHNLDSYYQGMQELLEDWKTEYRTQFDAC